MSRAKAGEEVGGERRGAEEEWGAGSVSERKKEGRGKWDGGSIIERDGAKDGRRGGKGGAECGARRCHSKE